MYELFVDIRGGLLTILAALLAYLLGLRAYHLQKEFELVRRRYLDEGLDAFAADVEHALSVSRNNWQHSLEVLKYYRDMGARMRKELLDEGYIDLDMSQFRVRPNFRIGELVGDKIFWSIQQFLFAFVGQSKSFFKDDLGGAVRHAITGGSLKISKDDMVTKYMKECENIQEQEGKYHILLAAVQKVTTEFEKQKYSLRSVHKFKDRPEVKEIVRQLKLEFSDKLKKYGGA